MEFPVPLLTLLQLQSYLVPCISARIFIIPRLQNIYWKQSNISELFFPCIEGLPNYYSVRSHPIFEVRPDSAKLKEHISRALPSEMIFNLLQSIPSKSLILDSQESKFDMLEIIIKLLQVSVSECN